MDSRFSSSYFRRSDASAEEVLEDSEPEREERRQMRKASKLRERRLKQGLDETSKDVGQDTASLVQPSAELPIISRGPVDGETRRMHNAITRSSPPESPQSFNPSTAEKSPVQPKILDLARFAYSGGAGPSKARSTRSPSRCSSIVEVPPPKTRKRKPNKAASTTFISGDDPELNFTLLLKCPSCLLKWTRRKSSSAKAEHIRTCASKNGMTEEAAREAIRQAIADAPSGPPPKGKRKAKATKEPTPVPELPKTYLDNVVEDAAPKKRQPRRKRDATVTVQPPTTTHNLILERAKELLTDTQPSLDLRAPATLSSAESDVILLEDPDAPPPTQPFLKSKLATALRRPLLPSHTENQPSRFEVAAEEALAFFEEDGSSASGKVSPKRLPFRDTPKAEALGLQSPRLAKQMRTFLDAVCIIYYERK
ncbi:hypothetical protein M407DRAFT_5768 [Tulasnella calospora MUT 4182]|uniref:Uncharacterized protein n=1 Tax=Tulasnella calospora MUT 4182 TaxID=1051891 RepID=A0A0C3M973_9AGAM|nr:hypothetical protein M407DRAFT_5768 [Tulasnella calospora MUT 4182]